MPTPLQQHQIEIQRNQLAWNRKPSLRAVYESLYREIQTLLNPTTPGPIAEIGSGIGSLQTVIPHTICTDLFPNPWVHLACDGYDLPFANQSLSHLLLVDVFHHLQTPAAFLLEAHRTLHPNGRIILLEPYISCLSLPVYGLLHHEPVAWRKPLNPSTQKPPARSYYAAQGNATRLFFQKSTPHLLADWNILQARALPGLTYILTGGFSGPSLAPLKALPLLQRLDTLLARFPRLFGVRCLVCLEKKAQPTRP
jgi:SAM-dependent methyltransferase